MRQHELRSDLQSFTAAKRIDQGTLKHKQVVPEGR